RGHRLPRRRKAQLLPHGLCQLRVRHLGDRRVARALPGLTGTAVSKQELIEAEVVVFCG
ncbi:hypothetical protein LCGC14_2702030, partial [marine sediment metagenome]